MKKFLFICLLLSTQLLWAQNPFQGISTGIKQKSIVTATDISNPNSLDETMLKLENTATISLHGIPVTACSLGFYKGRLFQITAELPGDQFESLMATFQKERGKAENIESKPGERSAVWYGEFKDSRFTSSLWIHEFYGKTVVRYEDNTQTDFQFSDLFQGTLLWVISVIIGLFVLLFIAAHLFESYCSNCSSFGLKLTGKSLKNATDYNTNLLAAPQIYSDEVYHYVCKKCGHKKSTTYSGFWRWYRNRK